MREKLEQIRKEALQNLADVNADLEEIRVRYLGKKGELTSVLRSMGQLSPEERPKIGQLANEVRESIEQEISRRAAQAKDLLLQAKLKREKIDDTMPGEEPSVGHLHPLNRVQREMEEIFIGMGFSIEEGPDVELDYYNFQALNIPEGQAARDTQDTFYISD